MHKSCFEKALQYTSPAHGSWGMVRIGMSVPESFQIFFAPAACGRHGAISAVMQGYRDRLAYYFLEEKDIVSGGYEAQIFDAVEMVLKRAKKKPKAMLLFVTCIDDLLGTDLEALTLDLNDRFEGIDFTFCHMDPIRNDSKLPPAHNIHQQMYRLLKEKETKKNSVNCIGNLMPVNADCELYTVLQYMGIDKVNHILQSGDYAGFQEMAAACCNLMIAPTGAAAVKRMKQDLDIPFLDLCVSYDLDIIAKQYETLQQMFAEDISAENAEKIDTLLSFMRRQAEEEIRKTKELLGDIPIYIDMSAVIRPYELARFLHRQGFAIEGIFAEKPTGAQKEALQQLLEECPDLKIMMPQHPKIMQREEELCETFSIGFEAAYITQSRYVLNLFFDEEMFGYYGLIRMMQLMRECYEHPTTLQELLDSYGLVV